MCLCGFAYVSVSIHMCTCVYVCLRNKILVRLSEFIQTTSLSDTLFVRNAHIHIYIHTHMQTYTNTHIHVYTYIYIHICVPSHTHIHMYTDT